MVICIAPVMAKSAGLHLRSCVFQYFHKHLGCRTGRNKKSKSADGRKLGGAVDPFEGREALQRH